MLGVDPLFWHSRRILLTGHTGFKGAWLQLWLEKMGAEVSGYALPPETTPSLFELLTLSRGTFADIRDLRCLEATFDTVQPEIVLHLAAQALVLPSFEDPLGTFSSNIMGTANLLDVVRRHESVRAVIVVTSDKCYENNDWVWGYRESDALGGHDPYSASKGAAELVISSMRRSFFKPFRVDGHSARIASVRAGNVIGGGDWSRYRLVPDIVRGSKRGQVLLRNPSSVRPWQHVLEPLAAYLGLAEKLVSGEQGLDTSFNIGPPDDDDRPVLAVAGFVAAGLGGVANVRGAEVNQPHEANLLRLDCSKARARLGWRPRWDFEKSVQMTVDWYRAHDRNDNMREFSIRQIETFMADCSDG